MFGSVSSATYNRPELWHLEKCTSWSNIPNTGLDKSMHFMSTRFIGF